MAFCPWCKTVVRDEKETCRRCGTPLPPKPERDPSKPFLLWGSEPAGAGSYEGDPEYDMLYPEQKSLAFVVVLNLILSGLGQIYLGQKGKGLLLMSPSIVGVVLGMSLNNPGARHSAMSMGSLRMLAVATLVLVVLGFVLRVVSIVDGVLIVNKMNQDKMVGKWEWF